MTTPSQALRLIEELMYNAKVSGNRVAERRLADLTVWFYKEMAGFAPENMVGRQKFLEKAMWILIEQMALLMERIHELESAKAKHLWTPTGMNIQGDVRRFG